jgi:hypothetical protein
MQSFKTITRIIAGSYTGRSMKSWIRSMGMPHPERVTDMYLRGEHPEYIMRASLAIMQIGE